MKTIQAAGGVVIRPDGRVLVVHRPRYDDWSLPKGKLDPGETHEQAALREVEEETGLRCSLAEELPAVSYADARGRAKVVRYWRMDISGHPLPFSPNDEVDELRWAVPLEAADLLTYERDREVLHAAVGRGA